MRIVCTGTVSVTACPRCGERLVVKWPNEVSCRQCGLRAVFSYTAHRRVVIEVMLPEETTEATLYVRIGQWLEKVTELFQERLRRHRTHDIFDILLSIFNIALFEE